MIKIVYCFTLAAAVCILYAQGNRQNQQTDQTPSVQIGWYSFQPGQINASSNELQLIGYLAEPVAGMMGNDQFTLFAGTLYSSNQLTDVDKETPPHSLIPKTFDLLQNYPNPFNPSTHIIYQLPKPGTVSITIYNYLGCLVKRLVSGNIREGVYTVIWDGTDDDGKSVSSGVYIAKLFVSTVNNEEFCKTRMMMFVK
jgi:hypothetical protein